MAAIGAEQTSPLPGRSGEHEPPCQTAQHPAAPLPFLPRRSPDGSTLFSTCTCQWSMPCSQICAGKSSTGFKCLSNSVINKFMICESASRGRHMPLERRDRVSAPSCHPPEQPGSCFTEYHFSYHCMGVQSMIQVLLSRKHARITGTEARQSNAPAPISPKTTTVPRFPLCPMAWTAVLARLSVRVLKQTKCRIKSCPPACVHAMARL